MTQAAKLLKEARRLLFYMRPDYCRLQCPGELVDGKWKVGVHEATCAEAQEAIDSIDMVLK